jgi:diaminohydroxyphosphoribosylaminopyrimidine deaminase/5-amino-6-(5-phosphoribosylamino)uracil reductase
MTTDRNDHDWMKAALGYSRRGLGDVWPNPAVGCVIVKDGVPVGIGWTGSGGRPHAEAVALSRAGEAARGGTAYVTLEPCSHEGRGPPCAEALIEAGIARVVIALEDPDPRVDGRGIARLMAAGVKVVVGVLADEARDALGGFLARFALGRPQVSLKLASTIDGRIATRSGESRWITGEDARARVHLLRARHDAILVGAATAIADDPELTVRLDGVARPRTVRIVADRRLRMPLTHRLIRTAAERPTWILTSSDSDENRRSAFRDAGVELIDVGLDASGRLDLAEAFRLLGDRGLTSVLAEGGAHLAASLVLAKTVDRLYWFRAATALGGDGAPALASLGIGHLAEAPRFVRRDVQLVGQDLLETYGRAA